MCVWCQPGSHMAIICNRPTQWQRVLSLAGFRTGVCMCVCTRIGGCEAARAVVCRDNPPPDPYLWVSWDPFVSWETQMKWRKGDHTYIPEHINKVCVCVHKRQIRWSCTALVVMSALGWGWILGLQFVWDASLYCLRWCLQYFCFIKDHYYYEAQLIRDRPVSK